MDKQVWGRLGWLFMVVVIGLGLVGQLLAWSAGGSDAEVGQGGEIVWGEVFTETFEQPLDSWFITDTSSLDGGEYYWGGTVVTASEGVGSVWSSGGGMSGTLLTPLTDTYPAYSESYLQSPPIDISGTVGVSVTFDYWGVTQAVSDTLVMLTSFDGISFTAQMVVSGTTGGWQTAVIAPPLPPSSTHQLWLAFQFSSDGLTETYGVFIDNVAVWAAVVAPPPPISASAYMPALYNSLPTVEPKPAPEWLGYVNELRLLGGLPLLTEDVDFSAGAELHSLYMVKNDDITHNQDPANEWYTAAGAAAGASGNIYVSSWLPTPDEQALNFWIAGAFHGIGLLDPQLERTGMGSYREAVGTWQMGATIDVLRGRAATVPDGITFPLMYPRDGGGIWVRQFNGFEYPDPLKSCPGFATPTGAPLYLQLGGGELVPAVTEARLERDGVEVSVCVFDETSYVSADPVEQASGRATLASRDAVVILPEFPLQVGALYTATVVADGVTHSWSFTGVSGPGALGGGGVGSISAPDGG
ncbi:MAG TPA: CAP domain-containing protein [Anaerolineae bacterium]|nr:CAP domain-containing protein [Anaerolineae bacterium]